MKRIHRVAILGAGTMGARIAAHFANAGVPSLLLDIVPTNAPPDRDGPPATKSRLPDSTARASQNPPPSSKPRFPASLPWAISTTT